MPPQIEGRFWYTEGEGETTYSIYIAQPKVRKAYICHEEKVKTEYKTENVNH